MNAVHVYVGCNIDVVLMIHSFLFVSLSSCLVVWNINKYHNNILKTTKQSSHTDTGGFRSHRWGEGAQTGEVDTGRGRTIKIKQGHDERQEKHDCVNVILEVTERCVQVMEGTFIIDMNKSFHHLSSWSSTESHAAGLTSLLLQICLKFLPWKKIYHKTKARKIVQRSQRCSVTSHIGQSVGEEVVLHRGGPSVWENQVGLTNTQIKENHRLCSSPTNENSWQNCSSSWLQLRFLFCSFSPSRSGHFPLKTSTHSSSLATSCVQNVCVSFVVQQDVREHNPRHDPELCHGRKNAWIPA